MAKTKKPVASAGGNDASRGSRRHLLLVAAALVAGIFVIRKLQASSSTSGATVPVDPNTVDPSTLAGDPSLTTGGSGLGGVAVAGDGSPAVGQTDLVNALSPFSGQLDNLQTEVDAVAATVTTLLPDPTTDPTAKPAPTSTLSPSQFTIKQLAAIGAPGAGPSPFSDADTLALAHEFGAMTPTQLQALGIGPKPAAAPKVETLYAAPVIVSTPTGATPAVATPTPAPSAPTPRAAPTKGKLVAV